MRNYLLLTTLVYSLIGSEISEAHYGKWEEIFNVRKYEKKVDIEPRISSHEMMENGFWKDLITPCLKIGR